MSGLDPIATLLDIDTNPSDGWAVAWDTSSSGDGSRSLTATATDTIGQTRTSTAVHVTVDNFDDPPTVSISSPQNGANVSGTVNVAANASDDRGLNQVAFFVDGELIGVDALGSDGWSVSWDTTTDDDGIRSLIAVATDTLDQATSSGSVSVNVMNSVPPTLHCGDLDSTSISLGGSWQATVTVTIHDAGELPVSGALVSANWSGGSTGSGDGTTDAQGRVVFTSPSMAKRIGSVTFTISNVTHPSLSYAPTSNHDPDGDSNGTSIVVNKP